MCAFDSLVRSEPSETDYSVSGISSLAKFRAERGVAGSNIVSWLKLTVLFATTTTRILKYHLYITLRKIQCGLYGGI